MEDIHTFSSGAASSGMKPRYDLIPPFALKRIAERFSLGAAKYGDNNWMKGVNDREFILDRLNHAVEHLYNVINGIHHPVDSNDDDLAAVILNCIFAMAYEETRDK